MQAMQVWARASKDKPETCPAEADPRAYRESYAELILRGPLFSRHLSHVPLSLALPMRSTSAYADLSSSGYEHSYE